MILKVGVPAKTEVEGLHVQSMHALQEEARGV
jgi:hypothetical protein